MKKHLISILVLLSLIIVYIAFLIFADIYNIATSLFGDYTGLTKIIANDYFQYHSVLPPNEISYTFTSLKAFAYFYLIVILIKGWRLIRNMIQTEILYKDQHKSFNTIGISLIRFSTLAFGIYLFFGIFFYNVHFLHLFINQGPLFISLFLSGKVLVISSIVTEKGERYKQENDLTV